MKVVLIIFGIILAMAIPLLFFMLYGMNDIRKLVISHVDISSLSDGIYRGSFHKGRWTYDLEITIKGHKISSIKNTNPRMAMFDEFNTQLIDAVIKKQGLDVDTVSGASIHTLAFRKACENAFQQGPSR